MKILTVGGAMIDTIAIIDSDRIERTDPLSRSSLSIDARSVSSATRWRRLLAAHADSILEKFGSGRTIDHAAAGARTELRGHRQPAASKDQRYRVAFLLFIH
jgi:predicted secreted protein